MDVPLCARWCACTLHCGPRAHACGFFLRKESRGTRAHALEFFWAEEVAREFDCELSRRHLAAPATWHLAAPATRNRANLKRGDSPRS